MSKKIFSLVFYSGVVLVCILFLPALIFPKSIVIYGGKILGKWSKFCLKFFLSTEISIIGKENILSNKNSLLLAHTNQLLKHFIFKQFLVDLNLY